MYAALNEYTDDPDRAALTDFVLFDDLYKTYVRHFHSFKWQAGDGECLTRREFGAAMMRVFPYLDEDRWKNVKRNINGERCRGYIGLRGPACITVVNERGNPRFKAPRPDKARSSTAKV